MMILVVGATGMLGAEVCAQLRKKGHPTRALVREGSAKQADLEKWGCEIFHGDLKDPASLEAACKGVTAIISTANAVLSRRKGDSLETVDRMGHLSLIEAAKQQGVSRFIYISVSPHLSEHAPLVRIKREIERALQDSSLKWTVLQPSAFMEVHLSKTVGWDYDAAKAMVFGPGTLPVSWISVADVAQYAVAAFEQPSSINQVIPIGGPQALTAKDVVKTFETVSGKKYTAKHVPTFVLSLMSTVLKPLNPVVASLMGMARDTARSGDPIDQSLQRKLPVTKLTSVEEFARQNATKQ